MAIRFSFRRNSGGLSSLEKELSAQLTEDGLPQYEFAEDLLLSNSLLQGIRIATVVDSVTGSQ